MTWERYNFFVVVSKVVSILVILVPQICQSHAKNIPFTVGNEIVLWNKLMKEVGLGRVTGPYDQVPFPNYIQSPIGLVPKAGSDKTRLIFHLSYQFRTEPSGSVNFHTPRHLCTVKYRDLDFAAKAILDLARRHKGTRTVYTAKTDTSSAFRILPLSVSSQRWTVMCAHDPSSKVWKYFVDKCLPFGASISCALFQRFSNALRFLAQKHNTRTDTGDITNYLDDFLFIALILAACNGMVQDFIDLCDEIGVPISMEKMFWASEFTVFLGMLLDGRRLTIAVPEDKRAWAVQLLEIMVCKKKATVKDLQKLCGYLNFLTKAVVPGRVFLRRMYSKYSKIVVVMQQLRREVPYYQFVPNLKPHHHVWLDAEFKSDCKTWLAFLNTEFNESHVVLNRPMIDVVSPMSDALVIPFYSDASAVVYLGFGCVYEDRWICSMWEEGFIQEYKPSIEYLELYALMAGILTWGKLLKGRQVIIHCDNMAVVHMVNNNASTCKHCMTLLRLLTLDNLIHHTKVWVRFIGTKSNDLADSLSRGQMTHFHTLVPFMRDNPDQLPQDIWPLSRLWRTFLNSIH